jgi:hypothetical protein
MAADLIAAGNSLKSRCYDMVREYFDDLGLQWLDDDVADAWIGLVRGVSDGINAMVASVIEDRIDRLVEQRAEYVEMREKLADLAGRHSQFCPDCIADADAIGDDQ